MKLWVTEIKALDAQTGEMKTWMGDYVSAPSFKLAQKWCDENKGYLKVVGELVSEIPCKEGTYNADWENVIDYEKMQNN